MKRTTQYAIAATLATALMGSGAYAADLGGNCCADLEERIAELEATTVRKGNRRVSVQLSGFVGHQVMWWDDGTQTDFYIGDGGNIFSRYRFRGEAKVTPQITAGFLYEFGVHNNAIGSMNQLNGGDDLGGVAVPGILRDSTIFLRHQQLGMVKIGHGSTSTDNLILIDLSGRSSASTPDVNLYNGGFILRSGGGLLANAVSTNWGQAFRGHESWDTTRRNHVLYESPALHGFTLQAAVGEDNYWDVALRYAGEHHGFRVAWGIGYQEDTEFNAPAQLLNQAGALCGVICDAKTSEWKGSASILHVQTGLFLTGAWGVRELEGSVLGTPGTRYTGPDHDFWFLSGGVAKNFFGIGNTVLFAEYGEASGGLEQGTFLGTQGGAYLLNVGGARSSSDATHWGLGINQYVDAAAMELFATYKNFSLDSNGFIGANLPLNNNVNDLQMFIVGTRINF